MKRILPINQSPLIGWNIIDCLRNRLYFSKYKLKRRDEKLGLVARKFNGNNVDLPEGMYRLSLIMDFEKGLTIKTKHEQSLRSSISFTIPIRNVDVYHCNDLDRLEVKCSGDNVSPVLNMFLKGYSDIWIRVAKEVKIYCIKDGFSMGTSITIERNKRKRGNSQLYCI